jgi:hypothetical protein
VNFCGFDVQKGKFFRRQKFALLHKKLIFPNLSASVWQRLSRERARHEQ